MPERTVYILLTSSGTWFSRLIHLATQDRYTHASIGLDGPMGPFYSFARKRRFALPAGLVEERVSHTWDRWGRQQVPCRLYALRVSEEVYRRLRRRLRGMYARREEYGYNLLGALSCWFRLPLRREHRYFCSQFVADLLQDSGAADLGKAPGLLRPADFCRVAGLRLVHQGDLGGLTADWAA